MSDDLAELLAAGERAAFHGRPASGVAALESAFERARDEGKGAEATAAAWLLGVCLAAAGKFGGSLAVLEPLVAGGSSDIPERRLFGALAAATSAAVRRQLGQHAEAKELDDAALTFSGGAPEAAFDALVGLAADAVAGEDPVTAMSLVDRAKTLVNGHSDWWRQRVRLGWVDAEVAMLKGEPSRAATLLAEAVQLAEVSGAPRHVAKTLLLLAVAQVQGGEMEDAEGTLRRAATLAESLGALPTLWPSRALLGALLEERSPAEAAKSLASARSGVIAIADDLPEGLRDVWLDRPDVAALLGG